MPQQNKNVKTAQLFPKSMGLCAFFPDLNMATGKKAGVRPESGSIGQGANICAKPLFADHVVWAIPNVECE